MRGVKVAVAAVAFVLVSSGCTTIVRSSVATDGSAGDQDFAQMTKRSISDDGRYVAFADLAGNLVSNDTNGTVDVFRRDNQTGTTIRVSVSPTGAQLAEPSLVLAISGNGDRVVFQTAAAAESSDTNGTTDYYVRTISTGVTERVSIRPDGTSMVIDSIPLVLFSNVTISDDGRLVLMREAQPGVNTFFLRDLVTGTTRSLGTGFGFALLSGDGRYLAAAPTCIVDQCPKPVFVTVADLHTEVIDPDCTFKILDFSADGRYVVGDRRGSTPACEGFETLARRDRVTKELVRMSLLPTEGLTISNDGRFVALPDSHDVAVADFTTKTVQYAGRDAAGQSGASSVTEAALSGDGRYVELQTRSKLVPEDTTFPDPDTDDIYTTFAVTPQVTSVAPTSIVRGAAHVSLTIIGSELISGATVAVAGHGVTVNSVTMPSPTVLKVDVSVSADAAPGVRNVVVGNAGGFGHSDAMCAGCLTIT